LGIWIKGWNRIAADLKPLGNWGKIGKSQSNRI